MDKHIIFTEKHPNRYSVDSSMLRFNACFLTDADKNYTKPIVCSNISYVFQLIDTGWHMKEYN